MFHTIEEALADLKQGKMIIVVDDENRENEGDFVALAELATPEVINFMATYGKGLICTPLSPAIASHLQLAPMVARNTDFHQTAFSRASLPGWAALQLPSLLHCRAWQQTGESSSLQGGWIFGEEEQLGWP